MGDYLFAQSATRCVATGDIRVIGLFAQTLASMCQGQIEEASRGNAPAPDADPRAYYQTIWGKTASLFVLACEGSAILAGLPEPQIAAMRRYGDRLGLAFQVVDDILDFVGDEAQLGKPVGERPAPGHHHPAGDLPARDPAAGRVPGSRSPRMTARRWSSWCGRRRCRCGPAEADRLLDEAREALQALPQGARDALEALTQYVVDRRV